MENHLYGCVTSTKWFSFMRHVNNQYEGHPNALYYKCSHGEIAERKKWIKVGKLIHNTSAFL